MSTGSSEQLSFTCPQCDKKLRAPAKLAGQKLSCPKCSAPIRVPGVAPSKNDDDDWLSLDNDPGMRAAVAKAAPVELDVKATNPSADSMEQEDLLLQPLPVSSEAKPTTSVLPTNSSASSSSATTNSSVAKRSVFDDDLPDLLPLETPPATPKPDVPKPAALKSVTPKPGSSKPVASKPVTPEPKSSKPSASRPASGAKPGSKSSNVDTSLPSFGEVDDFPLAPLEPQGNARSLPGPMLVGSLEEIMLESKALEVSSVRPQDEEFAFPCKVCGTRLHTSISKVGSRTRCPDCYTEFSVPSPPPRKKQQEIKLDKTADVTFAPIDARSLTSPESTKTQSDKILDKAKEDLQKEREEQAHLTTPFNSQRWLALVFWFCRDPVVVILMVMWGCICAAWLSAVTLIPEVFQIDGTVAALIQSFVFFGPGVMLLGGILIIAMSILSTVANQLNRIQEWPFGKIGESMGELVVLFAAMVLASIPGGIAGTALSTLMDSYLGTVFGTLASMWALLPFFLLSMADTNSMMEPFSKSVFDSMKTRVDAWGAMYFQTMLAVFCIFVTMAMAMMPGIVGEVLCGLTLPFLILFIFNQYGLLAGRISGLTDLGFTGDFSEDDAS